MRVGLYTEKFIEWGGGIDFIRILLNGLKTIQEERKLEIVLFIPLQKTSKLDTFKLEIKRIINILYQREKFSLKVQKPLDIEESVKSFLTICELEVVIFNYDKSKLETIFKNKQIDVVLPCFYSPGKSFQIPWVGYIYDFQHTYYPEFFKLKEIKLRNKFFKEMSLDAKVILVNALEVKRDLMQFSPNSNAQIVSLPFCPLYSNRVVQIDNINHFPNIPEKFFIISNQFWQHKNHKTAFLGLAKFYNKYANTDVHLLCTGEMYDYRNPKYLSELQKLLIDNNIQNRVHLLGYISKNEQQYLMAKAIGLVQPTLFEGGPGGGSAYEAIAMGKKVLLSDILVNKEINKSNCLFFEALNPDDFADKLFEMMNLPEVNLNELQEIEQREKRALGEAIGLAMDFALGEK
ncbi:MAG: glycosyltransferase [bacterium]|nr:glycosyltransferase [bacterium]